MEELFGLAEIFADSRKKGMGLCIFVLLNLPALKN